MFGVILKIVVTVMNFLIGAACFEACVSEKETDRGARIADFMAVLTIILNLCFIWR